MNKLMTIAIALVAVSVFSVNAQTLKHIPSPISMQERLSEMSAFLDNEGTKPIRNFDFLYTTTATHDSTSVNDSSISNNTANHDFVLPAPTISDSEMIAMDSAAEAYKWARIMRLASSKTPRYSIESLRSIHGDEKVVQEIAYSSSYPQTVEVHYKNIFQKIASRFAKKPTTEKTTAIANGY